MDPILVSAGKWRFEQNRWNWHADPCLGSKIIGVSEDVSFDVFLVMVYEDFGMNRELFEVKLSYVSVAIMHKMPRNTPPIFVTNERQFRGYIQQFRKESIRLCAEFGRIASAVGVEKFPKLNIVVPNLERRNGDKSPPSVRFLERSKVEDEDDEDAEGVRFDCCEDDDGASSDDEEVYGVQRLFKEEYSFNFDQTRSENGGPGLDGQSAEYLEIERRSIKLAVGQKYATKEDLVSRVKVYSVLHMFDFDVVTSTKKLLVVKCWVQNCAWKLRASCVDAGNAAFYIRRYVGEHTCSVTERCGRSRQATSAVLGRLYLEYVGGVGKSVVPNHVAEALNKRFGIKMKYWKAQRALKAARALLNGSAEDGYKDLPSYLYMVRRANPGTIVKLEVDQDGRFKFLFISFDACIRGFPYMRKVVVVDGTFLQGQYKGTLLTATMQDGNLQIFPMAFAVVDTENDESWEWFFLQLRRVIPDDQELAIISDRHKSIANAIKKVYPLATRGICTYHLRKNINTRFRGEGFKLFKKCATAYRSEEFDVIFDQILVNSPRLHKYLVDADVRTWSRVYFPGNRYNLTTSNIAESLNYAIYAARFWPVVQLIDAIRAMLTRWFADRRAKALATTTILTPAIEKLLQMRLVESRGVESGGYKTQIIDADVVVVSGFASSHMVNLKEKTCTCRKFDVDKIPCVHAVAAADAGGRSMIDLTDPYYYTSYWYHAYANCVMPRDAGIPVPADVASTVCLPPIVRNRPGRPKKKRFKGWAERPKEPKRPRKKTICSGCKVKGHNVRTCKSKVQS